MTQQVIVIAIGALLFSAVIIAVMVWMWEESHPNTPVVIEKPKRKYKKRLGITDKVLIKRLHKVIERDGYVSKSKAFFECNVRRAKLEELVRNNPTQLKYTTVNNRTAVTKA